MKIVITNTVALNGGDAAILVAITELLRGVFGPDVQFVVFDSQPGTAARYFPELTFRRLVSLPRKKHRWGLARALRRVRLGRIRLAAWCLSKGLAVAARLLTGKEEWRDLLHYHEADLVVSTGGTYLVENYSLDPRIFECALIQSLGRPLVFFTQSMGPFSRAAHRRALKRIFERALLVLLRDEESRKNLEQLELQRCRLHVCADAAFAMETRTSSVQRRARGSPANGELAVAVSVRHWSHFRGVSAGQGMSRYRAAIGQLCTHLVTAHGAGITFVSTCQGIPEYWTDDSAVACEIVDLLPEEIRDRVVVDRSFRRPQGLADMLASYDLVVATRMHMSILALLAGAPVLAIAYEFKTRRLFEQIGLSDCVVDMDTIHGADLAARADRVIGRLGEIRAGLPQHLARQRASAWRAAELVKHAYDRWAPRT